MTIQEYYLKLKADFESTVNIVRLESYKETGYEWIVVPRTGAWRTMKEQHGLFIQATDGIDNDRDGQVDEKDECVTKADAGQSPHNFNLARDIVPTIEGGIIYWKAPSHIWQIMGKVAVKNGLIWGGNFKSIKDLPHIEHAKWREIQALWRDGKLNIA